VLSSTAETASRGSDRKGRERTRTRTRRHSGGLAILFVVAAIALAACGSSPSASPSAGPQTSANHPTSSAATTTTATPSATSSSGSAQPSSNDSGTSLQYAQCMRSHGVNDFPDPNANGEFNLNAGSVDLNSPAFQAAQHACQKYMSGGAPTAQAAAQDLTDLLRYAQCMRSHSVTNFPDPTAGDPPGFHFPTNFDLTSPTFVAADHACHSLLPHGGDGHGS
jgi:hypothetical protein